jgi:hypothetical protein
MKHNLLTRLFYGAIFSVGKGLAFAVLLLGLAIYLQDAGLAPAGLAIAGAFILGLLAIVLNAITSMAYADQDPDRTALQQSVGDWILGGPGNCIVWFIYLCCLFSGSIQIFGWGLPVWSGAVAALVIVAAVVFMRLHNKDAKDKATIRVTGDSLRDRYANQAPPSAGRAFPVDENKTGRNPSNL